LDSGRTGYPRPSSEDRIFNVTIGGGDYGNQVIWQNPGKQLTGTTPRNGCRVAGAGIEFHHRNDQASHMTDDTYRSFNDLRNNEEMELDYRICMVDAGSPVTIIAPHAGKIEPKTSYITARIARDEFNYYCFEGIKANNNRRLHITSHKFDEPQALALLARSRMVVAIHACTESEALVYPGGLDHKLAKVIADELTAAGIAVADRNSKYQGVNPRNICNRGISGRGVQLEISRGLRDDINQIDVLCDAVYRSLTGFEREHQ
jgi:phage replication-related protein YjqB (UPF0714/DUF867 family)